MKLIFNSILIFLSIFIYTFGQSSKNVFLQADFNKIIEKYGKEKIVINIPQKQKLDSLKRRPYVWAEGYRIQLYAANEKENALKLKKEVQTQVEDSVYLFFEKGMYRIQFGDYTNRILAETKVDSMRKFGWPTAWIVTGKVKKFIQSSNKIKPKTQIQIDNTFGYFSVQVAAYSTIESAENIKKDLSKSFNIIEVIKINGLFKVLVGKEHQRSEAERLCEKVKNAGYQDAWLTFISE